MIKFSQKFMLYGTRLHVEGEYHPEIPSAYFEDPGESSWVDVEQVWVLSGTGEKIDIWEIFCSLSESAKNHLLDVIRRYFDEDQPIRVTCTKL